MIRRFQRRAYSLFLMSPKAQLSSVSLAYEVIMLTGIESILAELGITDLAALLSLHFVVVLGDDHEMEDVTE